MVKVSIIGTAGRDKTKVFSKELFNKMVAAAKYILANLTDVTLVSGGAAWADHVAVKLFLEGFTSKLILHLPCKWDNGKFIDNGNFDWRINPGRTANYYHGKFSEVLEQTSTGIYFDTLSEIDAAIKKGAIITVNNGFHARNNLVAQSEYLIAFTWSQNNSPTDGGTLDTWNKSNGQKYHVCLQILS